MRPDEQTPDHDDDADLGHGLGDPDGAPLATGYGDEAVSIADGAEPGAPDTESLGTEAPEVDEAGPQTD